MDYERYEQQLLKNRQYHQKRQQKDPDYREHKNNKAKLWYEKHKNDPELKKKRAATAKKFREENPEKYRQYAKDYYYRNKEK